ncbi:MAG: hypothetical protein GC162_12955 [Planctomycetes bacterium]|nr:hypothetical protein [Planctomycetota bacterium]
MVNVCGLRVAACGWMIVIAMLLVGGCKSMESMLGSQKPSASVQDVHFSNLSMDHVDVVFDVKIDNPYSLPLPLVDLDYALASGDSPFLDGKADVGGTVPANGSRTVQLPATISFTKLLSAVKNVKPGSLVPYKAQLNLKADAPVVGPMTLPISKSGEVPVPAVPQVELAGVEWKNLSLTSAAAVLKLNVTNTNAFPVDLSRMGYELSLAGKSVVNTTIEDATSFKSNEKQELSIPVSFSPANLGIAAFNLLRGKGSAYELSGAMDLKTPFGSFNTPFHRTGQTTFKQPG